MQATGIEDVGVPVTVMDYLKYEDVGEDTTLVLIRSDNKVRVAAVKKEGATSTQKYYNEIIDTIIASGILEDDEYIDFVFTVDKVVAENGGVEFTNNYGYVIPHLSKEDDIIINVTLVSKLFGGVFFKYNVFEGYAIYTAGTKEVVSVAMPLEYGLPLKEGGQVFVHYDKYEDPVYYSTFGELTDQQWADFAHGLNIATTGTHPDEPFMYLHGTAGFTFNIEAPVGTPQYLVTISHHTGNSEIFPIDKESFVDSYH